MEIDILIKNGFIVDGTGNPGYYSDIGISKEKIAIISKGMDEKVSKVIDATNHVVCPGFINTHSHSDDILLVNPKLRSNIHQGITTLVVGNCGTSWAPVTKEKKDLIERELKIALGGADFQIDYSTFEEYLSKMEKIRCPANLAFLIGYAIIRKVGGQGYDNRPPTPDELERMKRLIREGMQAGALGLSTGLLYAPQSYANTEEIIELAKVVGEYDGVYASHIRNEGNEVIEAIKECIKIAEKAKCKGHISHHKIAGRINWGKSDETLKLIEEANLRGVDITFDQYPYNRGAASLSAALPPWVHEGGIIQMLDRIKDDKFRDKIKDDVLYGIKEWENWISLMGFDKLYISSVNSEKWKKYEGYNISYIAEDKLVDPWEVFFDILIDSETDVSITIESMSEEDIRKIMVNKFQMFGTDCVAIPASDAFGKIHPRGFGTYPRVLNKYVKEEKILTLEDAIRRMTSFPASKFGFKKRGVIRENYWADMVIFNLNTVKDKATYENPHQYPEGIPYVIVNGMIVIDKGKQKNKKAGKILRRQS
jgi:N-acyl-D-aspartate/D-glutamate deacylase